VSRKSYRLPEGGDSYNRPFRRFVKSF